MTTDKAMVTDAIARTERRQREIEKLTGTARGQEYAALVQEHQLNHKMLGKLYLQRDKAERPEVYADAEDAALAQAEQPVAVKPLGWITCGEVAFANTAFGSYEVRPSQSSRSTDDRFELLVPGEKIRCAHFATEQLGRSAADADFKARILSALSPSKIEAGEDAAETPAPVTDVQGLDEATKQKLREALRFSASRSVMSAEDERRILSALETPSLSSHVQGATYTQAECDELCEIAERDGYEKAVQEIDQLTGGDGEYRVSILIGGGVDDERHTPDAPSMIQRIVDRFETLNLLNDATKTGRDQEWGITPDNQSPQSRAMGPDTPSAAVEARQAGDKVIYESAFGPVSGTIIKEVEGWWDIQLRDGSTTVVRPSRLRAALEASHE